MFVHFPKGCATSDLMGNGIAIALRSIFVMSNYEISECTHLFTGN